MKEQRSKHRILILGASGFIGNAIYKELCSYFNTFGTYNTARREFEENHQFFQYNVEEDDVFEILEAIRPTIIISALRGDFSAQVIAHNHLAEYIIATDARLFFISSANVFDAYSQFPSYELDKTLSHSIYGHFKIKIENMLMRLPKKQVAILRLPMVFGTQSPRIKEIKQHLHDKTPIEVFPNLIMNVTTDSKITQQIHYLINRNKYGIFHLGSTDLVHHDEFTAEIISSIGLYNPVFKQVYTTNSDRYLAVLPKENLLPKHLRIVSKQILTELEV
ncbi:sugar nucleotide-binding protein [Formosa algae]|uniref:dTDP-4-dehydrorhamnose reductase n=1 Tax=Formosa algae TaxID=225843 RepID=A0A9X1CD00_9FLAO|nr:sugar nucleotide-binding protein [Formosa algae]MBP1840815.1 dTDP-4-dehydrorhamnose reductase [Formosa algae]MDQ0336288.1 dTDP-4-dehydrorhamnose reductase [Formosa algae]OEI80315.1 dTDP-4-dehydrorhamnose reductase [Formosa algae]